MVLVQYRKNDKNHFSVEVDPKTLVGDVVGRLIAGIRLSELVNNARILLARLIHSVEELLKKGVLKPPELQGLSFEDMEKHLN